MIRFGILCICRFLDFRFSEDLDFTSRDPDYKLSRGLINTAIVNVQNNAGILLHLAEVRDMIYKDKLAGFESNIQYWGANQGNNQPPTEPERWLTGIKIELTLYEKMKFETEICQMDHPYSDIDIVTNELIKIFEKHLVITDK